MFNVNYYWFQDFGKEFDKHFGKGGSKLPGMKLRDFTDITDSLFYKMGRDSKPPGNLKECSPWMSDFKIEFLRSELEIPGEFTLGVTNWTLRRIVA